MVASATALGNSLAARTSNEEELHADLARRLLEVPARLAKIGIVRILQHADKRHDTVG